MERASQRGAGGIRRWRRLAGVLGTVVWWLVLLLLGLYGAVHGVVRTEFFRLRVEAELTQRLGMEMRVGRIRATESLNLKIRDVISVSEDAGIEARQVRIRWRLFRPRGAPWLEAVLIDGWAVTFAPDAAGVMQPALLDRVPEQILAWACPGGKGRPAGKRPAGEKAAAEEAGKAFYRGIPTLALRGGTLRLQDEAGILVAAVAGLDVIQNSISLPNKEPISHLDVRAGVVQIAGGPRIVGLHVELVDAGDRQFLTQLAATDWGSAPRPRTAESEYRQLLDAMD